jgi:hypothetical protein
MKKKIDFHGSGDQPMTARQSSWLWRSSNLEFWKPERLPIPTVKEAHEMLTVFFEWTNFVVGGWNQKKIKALKEKAVSLVSKFFPEWNGDSLRKPFSYKLSKKRIFERSLGDFEELPKEVIEAISSGSASGGDPKESSEPTEKTENEIKGTEFPEKKIDKKKTEKKENEKKIEKKTEAEKSAETSFSKLDGTIQKIIKRVKAGIKNLWLHGEAGTGKTTLCRIAGDFMTLPVTIISCSVGTSASTFVGYQFPNPRPSVFSNAFGMAGIIVIDEFTMLDPAVASVLNSALANGEITSSMGQVVRHKDCIIIATANTTGDGADRKYIANNQLDGATNDRFKGGRIFVDYNKKYEAENFDKEVCEFVWKLRDIIAINNFRRIASTRSIIAGHLIKKSGENDWKDAILDDWTSNEKQKISHLV